MRLATAPIATALVALTATLAHAADQGISSVAIDTSAQIVTDVRTRGISDSLLKPGARLTVNAAHESGLVGLAQLNTVSRKQFLDGAGVDITLGGGYRFGNPDAWHFGLGLATEIFPGASFEAPQAFDFENFVPTDFRKTNYDSAFAVLEAGYGPVEFRALNVISKTYRGANTGGVCGSMLAFSANPTAALQCYARGDHGSQGTWLFDVDYHYAINPSTTLNLHAGYQQVANFAEANFSDYSIGIVHKHWGFEFSADYVATNVKTPELYMVQDGDRVRSTNNSKLVLGVTKHF
jgi:hypothetical protein